MEDICCIRTVKRKDKAAPQKTMRARGRMSFQDEISIGALHAALGVGVILRLRCWRMVDVQKREGMEAIAVDAVHLP